MKKIDSTYEQIILANERTRFAAERTVSAWMRTGLASVGCGFAITRLIVFQTFNHQLIANAIGEILIVWGIFIFFFSLKDYKASCKKLKNAESKNEWWITTTIVLFIVVSLFLFLLTLTQ